VIAGMVACPGIVGTICLDAELCEQGRRCRAVLLVRETDESLLRQRIEELETALAPFARYARHMRGRWGPRDDSAFYGVRSPAAVNVRYGDFRRADRVYHRGGDDGALATRVQGADGGEQGAAPDADAEGRGGGGAADGAGHMGGGQVGRAGV
jgi:hypothetical protein